MAGTLDRVSILSPLGRGLRRVCRRPALGGARVADLGCGGGAIALMLLASDPSLEVTGVELGPSGRRGPPGRTHAATALPFGWWRGICGRSRRCCPPGAWTGPWANPPYFPAGSGPRRGAAPRPGGREDTLSLEGAVPRAAWLLKWGRRLHPGPPA